MPNPSAELCLLMALARPMPSERHLAFARSRLAMTFDWARLHRLAVRNNLVPLLHERIVSLDWPEVPADFRAALAEQARAVRWTGMLLLSRQTLLVERVLRPLGKRCALLKGITLGQRYYGNPFLRHAQDIDVLVAPDGLLDAASALRAQGWVVVNSDWHDHPLDVFARYASVIEMRSPEGVRVELHRLLDNTGLVFDVASMLERAVEIDLGGRPVPVLAPLDEFRYTCFHHARHAWSSLHWCVDLPAMMAAPGFETDVRMPALADPSLAATIAESIALARDLDALALGGALPPSRSRFLDACLASVDCEIAPPHHDDRDPGDMEPDFPMPWQKPAGYRTRFALSRLRPTINDYNAWPLAVDHHWLYWFTRPWRALSRRLKARRRLPV